MKLSRRAFLKTSLTGLALAVRFPANAQGVPELNAWIVVQPNDTVLIRYARSEMGQGSMTACAQLVAEELDCDWSRVRVEYADTNQHFKRKRVWGAMAAAGSQTIRTSQEYLRLAGATAREMLILAAAQSWNVPAAECSASQGVITHGPTRASITYGRVAAAAAKLAPPAQLKLKEPKEWKLAGTPVRRIDIPDIVIGRTRYGADIQLPGMVYAAVAHCPVFGGKAKSVDAGVVTGRRGVLQVLTIDDLVAVVADNWWRASEALKALPITWETREGASSATIMQSLREGLESDAGVTVRKTEGDPQAALANAERVFESEYFTPFLAHATLEPQTCTAVVKDGQVDVWTSTQDAEATHAAAAAAAGVPLQDVYVHRTQVGGGFGRRMAQDYVREGVSIAKAMPGVPVKLLWSREEDTQHDRYRPAGLVRFKAGLDETGLPVALTCRVSAPSLRGIDPTAGFADQPYRIPHQRVEYARRDTPVPVGFWRGVTHSQNPFARECFIDELAVASRIDPLDYRLRLLPESARERQIMEATAKAAGWGSLGEHRGLAVSEAFGSYTAAIASVSVKENKIRIERLIIGIDPGHVVNPDNVVAQLQGAAAFMLTALFWGEITFKDGRVEQSNFNDQRMLRLAQMPKVEVLIAASGGFWGGVGEAGVAAVGPAVVNALFAATGTRVRSLPLRNAGFDLG